VPEGDTVWLAGKRLRGALVGHELVRGELRHPELSTVDLTGRTVTGVASVGKHLLTRFDDGSTLHTHFLMDGSWHLYSPGARWKGPDHQVRAVLGVPDRVAVGFRLHQMALVPTDDEARVVGHLGPDLLDDAWGPGLAAAAVVNLTAQPDRELGQALLDQRVLAGLGNLYRTEMCFLLGVSPWCPVSSVDPEQTVRMGRDLLWRNADRPEQSTTGALGWDAQHWVFERAGRPCRRCGTRIRTAMQGPGHQARITYVCTTCQPGPHPPLTAGRRPQQPTVPRARYG
jgi:endonuclease-8